MSPAASSDPLLVVEVGALNLAEAGYVRAARAANTLRGYRSDWAEWCAWSKSEGYPELPATAEGISRYLTFLAGCGAKVGTMSRRLSGIRFAHRMRDLPDPTAAARVIAVWEGIRRTHGAPAEQAASLMPPELWDVIDRCPNHQDLEVGQAATRAGPGRSPGPGPAPRRLRRRPPPLRADRPHRRPGRRAHQRPRPRHWPLQDQPDRRTC